MARTSKRYIQEEVKTEEKSKFKAGVYTRLSNERSEEWRSKSFSIETQTLACKEYALKESIDVVEVYTDYEYSGTNFERPAFIKMMEDIKTRRINCILVRDLSRLGREYLEMGRLIDKVFPFLGVRFISVSDKVDTFNELDSKKSFEVTLKNIINDMYAKDISVKIKTSKHNRAKKGYFIGSVPPYGYKVEKLKEGQKLVIDESTSPIVRLMFDLALEGYSQYEIAKKFNEIGYTTAKTYYHTGRIYREDGDPEWHKGSISKMLVKPVYTGKLVQGVKQQNLAKGEKQAWADESEHIIVENAVPAIITTEEHENIISERKKRKDLHYFSCKPHDFDREPENRYKGKIFSKFSGKELVRRIVIYGKNKDKFHYVFRNERCTGKLNEEPNIHILERDIDEELEKIVGAMIKQGTSEEKLKAKIKKRYEITFNDAEKTIKALNKAIAKEELVIKQSYEKYKDGKLDIEKYRLNREIAQNHIQTNNDELVEIEDKANMLRTEEQKAMEWIQHLYKAEGIQKLSKELIDMLVEKIVVIDREHFDIEFRFAPIELKGACKDE